MERIVHDISWGSLWKIVAIGILVAALFYARDVIVITFIAVIVSSALYRPVAYLEKKKIPRILSVLVIFILAAAAVGVILYILVPVVLIQMKYFLSNINSFKIPFLDSLGASNIIASLNTSVSDWVGQLFYGGSNFLNVVGAFLGNIVLAFVTVVLSFYLAISKGAIERFIRSIMPKSKEEYVINLYIRTRHRLGKWFTSQLILSFFVGALTFIGLLIVGTDYALVLGILAAVLEIIPYVGPIAIGVISFIIILPQSASAALLAVIIFFIIQQLENHVLVPLIVGKTVGIDPVLVVIAILAGSSLDGLVGALIAVPVAIVLEEVIDDWSVKKNTLQEVID